MKRRHITRAALIAGCVGLMCGVAVLVRMSVDEYDDVLAQLARERDAVHALARHDLEDVLHGALDGTKGELSAARSSFFIRDNLFERHGDDITYPPPVRFGKASRIPGLAHLTATDVLPDGDWGDDARERWRLATSSRLDIDAFLDHRARYRVPGELDVVSTLAAFERTGGTDALFPAELVRQIIREGVVRTDGRIEGLMGLFVAARERFSEADFMTLAGRIAALGKRYLVRVDDFEHEAARRTPEGRSPVVGATPNGAALDIATQRLAPGRRLLTWTEGETEVSWAVEVAETDGLRTVLARRLDADWLDGLAGRLVAADLIDIEAEVSLAPDGRSILLESPRWRAEVARAERRLWLKGIPAGTIALLGLAVTVMAFTLQRRREAYIRLRASLLTAVTHELKTPLASIRAMAETLERRLEGDSRARDYPRRIVRSSERLGFLVDNILSFARLDREAWKLQKTLVPLADLVARVRERAEAMAPRGEGIGHPKPARFEVDTDGLVLEVDPELVQLLLANLVDNAMRYAVADDVRIQIRGRVERNRVVVTVSDNGPGMDGKTAPVERAVGGMGSRAAPVERAIGGTDSRAAPVERAVGGMGSRVAPVERAVGGTGSRTAPVERAVGGTGLGLVLCRLIMELHGGAMKVAESSEHGTTFELEFELSPHTSTQRDENGLHTARDASRTTHGGER